MNAKFRNILILTFIYFFFGVVFLLIFRTPLIFVVIGVLPLSIRNVLASLVNEIIALKLIGSSYIYFIILELPTILLGYVFPCVLFRKKYLKKEHLLAMIFSILIILAFGLNRSFYLTNRDSSRSLRIFSPRISINEMKCNLLPEETIFDWTYPLDGQMEVSIHSPVVVNLKNGVTINGSCEITINGLYAGSSKLLGNSGGKNIPLVPDGGSSISELDFLGNASLDEIKVFESGGSWDENSTILVTCSYIKSGCPGIESFSFITGED